MHTKGNQNTKYNPILLQRLNEIVPTIVDAFEPEEIIMYGSYARGDNDIYSDIDLIIVAHIPLRFQERSLKVLEVIEEDEDKLDLPVNPIVYTPDEFSEMLKNKESFLVLALEESVLLWKKDTAINVERQLESKEWDSDFKKYLP